MRSLDMADIAGRFRLSAPKGKYEVLLHQMGFKDEVVPVFVSRKGGPGFKVVMAVQAMVDYIRTPEPSSQE